MNIALGGLIGIFALVAGTTCTVGVKHANKEIERLTLPEDAQVVNIIRANQFHSVEVGGSNTAPCAAGENGMEFRAENSGDAPVTGVACYRPDGTNVTLHYTKLGPGFKPRLIYP